MATFKALKDFRHAGKFKLVPHLERAIKDFDEEWTFTYEPRKKDLGWHPSGDCIPPPSALYASAIARLHDEPHTDKINKKYGMVGHFWHQYLQHILVTRTDLAEPYAIERRAIRTWPNGSSPLYQNRIEVVNDKIVEAPFHYATGAADVAPCVIPKYGEYVVDFKTMSSQIYRQVTLPEFFATKYECQINIYMDFFGLEKGLIVAVNKDTPHDMKEFEYRRNDELVAAIYDKWKFVSESILHDDPPGEIDDPYFELPTLTDLL